MNSRLNRRPHHRKQASKSGAVIFGVGVLAILVTVTVLAVFTIPGINRRAENLPYYLKSYYRKIVPHPEYLPTPAPAVAFGSSANSSESVELNLPSVPLEPTAEIMPPLATEVDTNLAAIALGDTLADEAKPPESVAAQVELAPTGSQVQLTTLTHQWQTWNNCGPATITMNTSYFGRPETQVEAAQFLKPNKNDKNVNPHELAAYARTTGLQAQVRRGGSIEQLKKLLNNGLPVLAETWLVHDDDGLGHYRLLTGYNDETGQFTTFDSLNGPQFTVSYAQFDADWRVFNRLYLVVYPAEQAGLVNTIIGPDIDDTEMHKRLVREAQAEIEANPNDAIAYFNLGDALTRLRQYDEAVVAFDQARQLGLHWRRLWYQFTPFEAYYAVGRYQDVLDLAEATIEGAGGLEEAYYYQGLALHATGQEGVIDAFQQALAYNANFSPAADALESLTAQ